MSEHKLFFGGVPVGPDVAVLDQRYPELNHGDMLTHDELSEAIGYSWRSSRYRTVLTAWRHQLFKERGIELQAVRAAGMRVMTNTERVDSHIDKTIGGIKAIAKAGARIAAVPRSGLPDNVRAKADNAQAAIAKMNVYGAQFRKDVLAAPAPQPQAPRLVEFLKTT